MNKQLLSRIVRAHKSRFGQPPTLLAYAPGRAEVLGNHTDYNAGTVLSTAIDLGICFALRPNNSGSIRIYAADIDSEQSRSLSSLKAEPKSPDPAWQNYVLGVLYYHMRETGFAFSGADCCFGGDLPRGAGLSSSAALEVAASLAFEAAGLQQARAPRLDNIARAKLCQKAEHVFVGTKSGLLDQFSSIFGQDSQLIHSDFCDLSVRSVPVPSDLRFLLLTPEARHELASSPYNRRRASCEEAARLLGKLVYGASASGPWSLRDFSPEQFEEHAFRLPAEPARRAAHVIGEISRVQQGRAALERGDIESFGAMMTQSHESSQQNFENSSAELDQAVAAALQAGALGARLSGGGWGGSVIALARAAQTPGLLDKLAGGGSPLECRVLVPSQGARLLDVDRDIEQASGAASS